jgi:3-hydroxybutyryl-CoA dehydratase
MEAFAALSHDRNPLHWDTGFAQAAGFSGPVVYGGLLVAMVSRMLGSELPGPGCVWHSVTLQFREPLYPDEPARCDARVIHWNEDLKVIRLAVEIRAADRLVASGEVQAILTGPPDGRF